MKMKMKMLIGDKLQEKGLPPHFFEMGFTSLEEWRQHCRKKEERRREVAKILKKFDSLREYWRDQKEAEQRFKALFDKRAAEKAAREQLKKAPLDALFG